ncbi:MAG: helix-turn-helix transcriptional regulator [Gammaproteobacteria bacterium]
MDKLLSDRDVSATLNCSRASVWRWVRRGLLPPPILVGQRTRRWRQADIERFIAEREASA